MPEDLLGALLDSLRRTNNSTVMIDQRGLGPYVSDTERARLLKAPAWVQDLATRLIREAVEARDTVEKLAADTGGAAAEVAVLNIVHPERTVGLDSGDTVRFRVNQDDPDRRDPRYLDVTRSRDGDEIRVRAGQSARIAVLPDGGNEIIVRAVSW